MPLVTMYITNSPEIAHVAEKNGVNRVFIDLEYLGKEERQKNMNSVKSNHKISDISEIKKVLSRAEVLVRINPWNQHSQEEVEAVIERGADIVMLPMFHTTHEVKELIKCVNGRTKVMPLIETKDARELIDEIVELEGIDELYIGLNDLHLDYKKKFMFELLADGTVEELAQKINAKKIPFGFGGIAKLNGGMLPASRVILEHYRLGSTRAILSRSFCNTEQIKDLSQIDIIFKEGLKEIRDFEKVIQYESEDFFDENKEETYKIIGTIVQSLDKR